MFKLDALPQISSVTLQSAQQAAHSLFSVAQQAQALSPSYAWLWMGILGLVVVLKVVTPEALSSRLFATLTSVGATAFAAPLLATATAIPALHSFVTSALAF